MTTYGLRHLYQNLGSVLKKLPFAITKHGQVIAIVRPPTKEEKQTIKKEDHERRV